jgi:hypothetical protein
MVRGKLTSRTDRASPERCRPEITTKAKSERTRSKNPASLTVLLRVFLLYPLHREGDERCDESIPVRLRAPICPHLKRWMSGWCLVVAVVLHMDHPFVFTNDYLPSVVRFYGRVERLELVLVNRSLAAFE